MRRLAVRTNWPTAALKPLRKALKGYTGEDVSYRSIDFQLQVTRRIEDNRKGEAREKQKNQNSICKPEVQLT